MKSFSLLLAALSASSVSAAHPPPLDYAGTFTGGDKCALINVVMDESGSMRLDQSFIKNTALPRMARELRNATTYGYDNVFICSTGFTNYNGGAHARELGCSTYDAQGVIANGNAVDYMLTGGFEDGWHGIQTAIDTVPSRIEGLNLLSTCSSLEKNIILVTDEDRDNHDRSLSIAVKNYVQNTGYVLNVVANVNIGGTSNNFGMKIDSSGTNSTIFQYQPSAPDGYITTTRYGDYKTYTSGSGTTHSDYSELIVGTTGALWSIHSLRDSSLAAAFSNVFVDVKVEEINKQHLCPSSGGDPHITTWKNEHYEYHGQCDLVLTKDPKFDEGQGLDIHIRTKIVRFWSYIKTVAIKIGDDILEIEGNSDADDAEARYWINFEYQGELETLGGFPVIQKLPSVYKRQYIVDLSSKYPGQSINVQIYKEFVRVKFMNAKEEVFGNTVGLMGDYKTGKTLARDGFSEINDFTELGDEWQVLPSEPKLFHEVSHPQFPEQCIHPEDPRGERKRRLSESKISIEQAEKACNTLKDPLTIKDCIYDILATQDLDMVGAF